MLGDFAFFWPRSDISQSRKPLVFERAACDNSTRPMHNLEP